MPSARARDSGSGSGRNLGAGTAVRTRADGGRSWRRFKAQAYLQAIALTGIGFIVVFYYLPMLGVFISFTDYGFSKGLAGIFASKWVGLKYFDEFFHDLYFARIIRNTFEISILKLVFSFPAPIIMAVVFNEVSSRTLKRVVQTVSYFPYFLSWVIVSGLIFTFLNAQDGFVNQALMAAGVIHSPIPFLTNVRYFYPMLVLSDIWKNCGWWTIIFMAAIAGIDQEMYEAALVDGASRLQRMWHITLPSMKRAIVVVLILSLGALLGGGLGGSNFEQSYLLGNATNLGVSDILQTYTLRMGLGQARWSYATAIGLLQSCISLILLLASNYGAKKATGAGIY
jgi:putative aldouronate transport system permease protein